MVAAQRHFAHISLPATQVQDTICGADRSRNLKRNNGSVFDNAPRIHGAVWPSSAVEIGFRALGSRSTAIDSPPCTVPACRCTAISTSGSCLSGSSWSWHATTGSRSTGRHCCSSSPAAVRRRMTVPRRISRPSSPRRRPKTPQGSRPRGTTFRLAHTCRTGARAAAGDQSAAIADLGRPHTAGPQAPTPLLEALRMFVHLGRRRCTKRRPLAGREGRQRPRALLPAPQQSLRRTCSSLGSHRAPWLLTVGSLRSARTASDETSAPPVPCATRPSSRTQEFRMNFATIRQAACGSVCVVGRCDRPRQVSLPQDKGHRREHQEPEANACRGAPGGRHHGGRIAGRRHRRHIHPVWPKRLSRRTLLRPLGALISSRICRLASGQAPKSGIDRDFDAV